jgi:CRP/FNR family transcriptional regulator/CRP/FNR family cyclic AMP-dependent transcriptional regulator
MGVYMTGDSDRILIEKCFKRIPVLKGLSDSHAGQIIKDFNILRIKKGDVVFYQSDKSTDLYIVINGSVRASLLNQEGDEFILATFNNGDFFGEMSLIDGRPRSATIIAAEDSLLGVLRRERFLNAIRNDPMIAIELLSALIQRMRVTDEMVESLAFLDVSQRLVKLLLQIAKTEGEKDKDGFFKVKKLTHRELAAHTGASREAISKSLKALAFRRIVIEGEGCFLISPDADSI